MGSIYKYIEIRIGIKTICSILCIHGLLRVCMLFVLLRALRGFNYAFQFCAHISRLSPAAPAAMAHLFIYRKSIEHVHRALGQYTKRTHHITSHVRHRQHDCQCEKGTHTHTHECVCCVLFDGHMTESGTISIQMIQTTSRPGTHMCEK